MPDPCSSDFWLHSLASCTYAFTSSSATLQATCSSPYQPAPAPAALAAPAAPAAAAETIRDVAVSFETIDFFTNRSAIDTAMTTALTLSLSSVVEVDLFNLLAVDIPDVFDAAVQEKVLTGQDVITLEQQRTVNVIRSQIAVIDAVADANVTAIVANATAQGLVIRANTQASTNVQYMGARGAALALLASDLGFNTTAQLLQYLYTDIIRGNTRAAPVLAIDIDAATVRV